MRADEISKHLRRQPFRPLRVYISEGSSKCDTPKMMYVSRTEGVIGLAAGDDVIPQQSIYCDAVHIIHIERLNGRRRKRGAKR